MRVNKLNGLLALLVFLGAVGCKSMPSIPWWKTASKTDAPDSTALAHDAPTLPSEVALQEESAVAAPYAATGAPGVSPASYPATSAPAFDPAASASTQMASTPSTAAASSSNVGSIAMPYNPNSVPPAPQTSSAIAQTADLGADRYSSMATAPPASPANYGASDSMATGSSTSDLGSRYGSTTASTSAPSYSSTTTAATSTESTSPYGVGDRYAQNAPASYDEPASSQPAQTQPTTVPMYPASQQNLAGAEPYRPGGTTSYPGTQPTYNVATRPEDTPSSSTSGQNTSDLTAPQSTTEPTAQRYW